MAGSAGTDAGRTMASGAVSPQHLVLILLAILALRVAALWLNRTDLFFDEAQYWSWAKAPALGYYSKPPLVAWVIAATTAVCGEGEPCVRLAAPILHTVTAWVVFLIGRRLYGPRVGFWSAIVFATLPGVSVSTTVISTDVPFLLFWALALWAFIRLRASDRWSDALLLGAAIGAGFLARYGMAFFVGSMVVALLVLRNEGARIDLQRWLAVALSALIVAAPNIYWNIANGFATIGHTADNAKWTGSLFDPLKALEFLGAQFGVFGPVLFGALLLIVWRAVVAWLSSASSPSPVAPEARLRHDEGVGRDRGYAPDSEPVSAPPPQAPKDLAADASSSAALGPPPLGGREEPIVPQAPVRRMRAALSGPDRLLLAFVLPILILYIGQAFVSRAHANWAAAGYVAATIMVTATMLREDARQAFRTSLGLHIALALVIALAPAWAGRLPLAPERDPYRRLLGWRELAEQVRAEVSAAAVAGKPYAAILVDDRGTLAELLYYFRDAKAPIVAWPSGPSPKDHFELTRPYRGQSPALLVGQGADPAAVLDAFESVEPRLVRSVQPQTRDWRPLALYRLEGYRPES
jgi:4-amino-4-deoxy-L-arabinose transferase-like glycosyltransferase